MRIGDRRLINQKIAAPSAGSIAEVVSHLGAMQAQDYRNALWAIGLRRQGATEAAVEEGVAERKIVRTWPMRGTLHFVAAADVHWMLELLTPRILSNALNREERIGLNEKTFDRCRDICLESLADGAQLTRDGMLNAFRQRGVATDSLRGYHILWRLAQNRLICFGPRAGKSATFVLLDEWVPNKKKINRVAALTELARRYFTSHGPATLEDLVRWAGLKISDARAAIENAKLHRETIGGVAYWSGSGSKPATELPVAHLLPSFDEYLLGYRDRSAVLNPLHAPKIVPGNNGVFLPTIVVNGSVVGTWNRVLKTKRVLVTASPFKPLSKSAKESIAAAAGAFGRFLGVTAELQFASARRGKD